MKEWEQNKMSVIVQELLGDWRSINSANQQVIQVFNTCKDTVSVVWVDYQGQSAQPCTIETDNLWSCTTYIGHPFCLSLGDQKLHFRVAEASSKGRPIQMTLSRAGNALQLVGSEVRRPVLARLHMVHGPSFSADSITRHWDIPLTLNLSSQIPHYTTVQWVQYDGALREPADGLKLNHSWSSKTWVGHVFEIAVYLSNTNILRSRIHISSIVTVKTEPSLTVTLRLKVANGLKVLDIYSDHIEITTEDNFPTPIEPSVNTETIIIPANITEAIVARDIVYAPPMSILGFKVHFQQNMPADEKAEMIRVITEDYSIIHRVVPPHMIPVIQQVEIYINHACYWGESRQVEEFLTGMAKISTGTQRSAKSHALAKRLLTEGRGVCLHWDERWLSDHCNNPIKAGHIEVYCARDYIEWRSCQPMMLLHEHSHGLERTKGQATSQLIQAVYQRVVCQQGKYQCVEYLKHGGQQMKAYAATDYREYFAETSEALFGINDYYPFNRQELEQYDPEGLEMVITIWEIRS
jgi:hypothetical protein